MQLTSEFFVMLVFIAGLPFYYGLLRDSDLKGSSFFLLAYICLLASNIFTVVEEFWLNKLFNFCEHLFITLASLSFLAAIYRLTAPADDPGGDHRSSTGPGPGE